MQAQLESYKAQRLAVMQKLGTEAKQDAPLLMLGLQRQARPYERTAADGGTTVTAGCTQHQLQGADVPTMESHKMLPKLHENLYRQAEDIGDRVVQRVRNVDDDYRSISEQIEMLRHELTAMQQEVRAGFARLQDQLNSYCTQQMPLEVPAAQQQVRPDVRSADYTSTTTATTGGMNQQRADAGAQTPEPRKKRNVANGEGNDGSPLTTGSKRAKLTPK
ncbi:hypothetical protein GPECTOR_37g231 [Gonium pectorale]|uniref:Uncharacterized protein n=1 Tax=Gonium pectorale TaxID=33097 RepID=A0A150GCC9_GONPE|nr:hypothetical protein GPECTOR_37g231 [Gonium pectorale]|eukprot:KXZ47225.1 hypothetical protein GPECTOR_37g231 [Gonium pectorale]